MTSTVETRRYEVATLEAMSRDELTAIADHMGLEMAQYSRRKKDYVYRILEAQFEREGQVFKAGVLEILDEGGYGFLRGNENYLASMSDVYVSSPRCAASVCAPATTSPARCARPRTTRSTTACCVSKPSTASTRRSPSAAPTSSS